MRAIFLPCLCLASAAAASASAPADPAVKAPETVLADRASDDLPTETFVTAAPEVKGTRDCKDVVTRVRLARPEPLLLDRETASPDGPYLIYAVDKRIDDCPVMVMMGDTSDIRPMPQRAEAPLKLIPLEQGR